MPARSVTVAESGMGPFGQFVIAGRHVFGADEPESLGGRDTGPDPYELVLAGLGACTTMTIRMYADRKQIPLTRIEVRLRHVQRASSGEGAADRLERIIKLYGELTAEQRQKLLEIADHCPVSKTLRRGAQIASMLDAAVT